MLKADMLVAQKIAEKSIVLLKNEHNVLPLTAASVSFCGVDRRPCRCGRTHRWRLGAGRRSRWFVVPPPPRYRGRAPWATFSDGEVATQFALARFDCQDCLQPKVTYVSGDDLAAASSAAKTADVAIVFAYQPESEGMDLQTLDLGAEQNKLIEAVAAANPKTIVVLETGSPATMPWIDKVAGVVEAWYPGIRGARGIANLLTGEVNPSGKLAITFPKSDADLPHPTLVLPPPASEPDVPRQGRTSPDFMAKMAKGLPPFRNLLTTKA